MGTLAEQPPTGPAAVAETAPRASSTAARAWMKVGNRWMPFADIATSGVPLSRFLRLSMFQLTVGMVQTLFFGTLNRVMIVELHISATLVSVMIFMALLPSTRAAAMGLPPEALGVGHGMMDGRPAPAPVP